MARFSADEALAKTQLAAQAIAEAGRRWGSASKELELASKAYETAVEDYYDAMALQREYHWQQHCEEQENCPECRVYDV